MENLFALDGTHIKSTYYVWTFPWYTLNLIRRMYSASKWAIWQKAIKKKLFLQIREISKFFFVKSKFHVVSKTYPNFTLVRLTMPDWEHFEKKNFKNFKNRGKNFFPIKSPKGLPRPDHYAWGSSHHVTILFTKFGQIPHFCHSRLCYTA